MNKLTGVIGLILIAVLTGGCGEKIKPGERDIERPLVKGVVAEEVTLSETDELYEASGTLRARDTAAVSAKIMGEVKEVKVRPGDRVKKNDVLIIINAPDTYARADAAREALEEAKKGLSIAAGNRSLAEKTYERYNILFEAKAISAQEFDEIVNRRDNAALEHERAQLTLQKAEAGLLEAEALRGFATVSAPISGTVAEKMTEVGSMAMPGTALVMIEGAGYRVEVPVDESHLGTVKMNDTVSVVLDAPGKTTRGKVSEIVHQIDPRSRTFTVKIDVDKDDALLLRGGSYVKAVFSVGKRKGIFVPGGAVVTRGDLRAVYTVDEHGVISFRLIRTGKGMNGMIEVLSGLQSGEKVIVSGTDKAIDGGKVEGNG